MCPLLCGHTEAFMSTYSKTCGTNVGRLLVNVVNEVNCRCVLNAKELQV